MADKPLITPFAMNEATMELALGHNATTFDDYTEAVGKAEFVPSTSTSSWMGIGGNTVTFATPSTWTLGLGGIQDDALEGLSAFLFDHDNARATVRLTPVDGGTVWTANITLSATKIGGTAGNTPADFDVTLAVQGKPTRQPATP